MTPHRACACAGAPYKLNACGYEAERCRLDLYLPDARPFPFVVWFHGGGLEGGDKGDDLPMLLAEVLNGYGIGVALPNYRLFPRADFPDYLEDAAAAFAWCVAGIDRLDPRRVFIGGHSAGAYLAAMIGSDPSYIGRQGLVFADIAGVIAVSGQMITHARVRQGRGLPVDVPLIDSAAPIWHASRDLPPFLNITGDNDMPGRSAENLAFAAAMDNAGGEAMSFHEIPGRDHSSIMSKIRDSDDPTRGLIVDFIGEAKRLSRSGLR